jgi:glutathione S-transferase
MLKIYGTSRSRATRSLWAAGEFGVPFEHIPTTVADTRGAEYLKINPNGHIPTIDDDGVVLSESMAINLYLAEKHGKPPLWPANAADRGRVFQWSFWGMLECESHIIQIFVIRFTQPEGKRDEKAIAAAYEALKKPLGVLDAHLKDRPFLLGPEFTVADLNVAGVLMLAPMAQVDLSSTPNVQAWLDRCLARPALQKARGMK